MSGKPLIKPLEGPKPRFAEVTLDYPFEIDGIEVRKVCLHRLTVGEIGAYVDHIAELKKADENAAVPPFPGLALADGTPVTPEIINALDPDDEDRLDEVLVGFLPRRLTGPSTEASKTDSPSPGIGASSDSSSELRQAGA